jgi:hypothetical protein
LLYDEQETCSRILVYKGLPFLGSLSTCVGAWPDRGSRLLVGVVGYVVAHVLRERNFFFTDHTSHPTEEALEPFEYGPVILHVGELAGRDGLVERDRVRQRVQ